MSEEQPNPQPTGASTSDDTNKRIKYTDVQHTPEAGVKVERVVQRQREGDPYRV